MSHDLLNFGPGWAGAARFRRARPVTAQSVDENSIEETPMM